MEFITSTIGKIAKEIKTGKTPPTKNSAYFNGTINWYTPTDLDRDTYLGTSTRTITELAVNDKKATLYSPNTVLIGCIGNIGKIGIIDEPAASNQQITGVLTDDKKVLPEFFFYWLKMNKELLEKNSKKAVVPILNNKQLSAIPITYPKNTEDQRRMVLVLTKAELLINQRKESIELADEFLKHTYLKMFGTPYMNHQSFEVGTIRDLVSEVKYGTSKSSSQEGKFAYLRMNNITYEGNMDYSSLKYIDLEQDELLKYGVKKLDLLFNRTNSKELVGKTAVFMEDEFMVIAGYLIRVRTNEQGNPWFIWGYLNSIHGKQTLLGMCKSIVGMANINAQELQNIKILLPPPNLQNKFAVIVEQIENLKKQYQKSLDELHELYRTLSHKAFNGDLTITEEIEIKGSLEVQPKVSGTIEVIETKESEDEDEDDGYRSYVNDRTEPEHFIDEDLTDLGVKKNSEDVDHFEEAEEEKEFIDNEEPKGLRKELYNLMMDESVLRNIENNLLEGDSPAIEIIQKIINQLRSFTSDFDSGRFWEVLNSQSGVFFTYEEIKDIIFKWQSIETPWLIQEFNQLEKNLLLKASIP